MHSFKIDFLDHIAIRVNDLEVSSAWYQKVLGLERVDVEEWKPYPIFLLSGKSGIALFPANAEDPELDPVSKNVKIDHFAFQVGKENFEKARTHFEKLGIEYYMQDHKYFLSIYTKDPDGHTVELTTLAVPESEFYK